MCEELKPCPFCGSGAQIMEGQGGFDGRVQVECSSCRVGTFYYEEAVAVKQWNRRVQAASVTVDDTKLLDWLNGAVVGAIHLDDGTVIDVRGNDVRTAIDAALLASVRAAVEMHITEPDASDEPAPLASPLVADK